MTRTLLVAGTASHVGKSTVVAGLCRHLADRGVDVAPFKGQNMSNNARVALRRDGEWGEIGVSQHVQCRAAGIVPTTDANPVLLKPRGGGESQLVVDGEAVGHYRSGEYYESHWSRALEAAEAGYDRLAAEHEVIVAEGAGGLGEVNLHHRDIANVEAARFADADVLILADIERGGAFASLYGTLELVPDDIRDRVVGAGFTKFRGDEALLADGVDVIEARTGIPILGVLPYDDPGLPAEDSVGLPGEDDERVFGGGDDVPDRQAVTIGVPRLPRISNFTDVAPLADEPGVRVAYVPLADSLDGVDAVVLPGTKNTVDDLLALREAGFGAELQSFGGPIIGICGGYQMLGTRLENAGVESTRVVDEVDGLGLLPIATRFGSGKRVERVARRIEGVGPLAGASGPVRGYEIHAGESRHLEPIATPIGPESAALGSVLGTYLHGLFENVSVRQAFVGGISDATGRDRPAASSPATSPFDRAATLVASNLDLEALGLPP